MAATRTVPLPSWRSANAAKVIVWSALAMVSVPVPLLAAAELSPAKAAPTPSGYVPAAMPMRLAFATCATPLVSVVAVPTTVPLSVMVTVLPASGCPPTVRVAVSAVVPP